MQPLIDAVRLMLWEIVQDLTVLEPAPSLRVALLTYGNRGLTVELPAPRGRSEELRVVREFSALLSLRR